MLTRLPLNLSWTTEAQPEGCQPLFMFTWIILWKDYETNWVWCGELCKIHGSGYFNKTSLEEKATLDQRLHKVETATETETHFKVKSLLDLLPLNQIFWDAAFSGFCFSPTLNGCTSKGGQKYSYMNFESEKIEKYELCPRCLESHCKSGWNLRGTQLCLKEETLCWLAASKIRWIRDIFRVWSFQRLAGVTGGRTVVWSTCTRGSTTGREARRTGIAVLGSRWQTVNNCFLHQKIPYGTWCVPNIS